jgi:transcriptional regulator with XRE-family HTH domain
MTTIITTDADVAGTIRSRRRAAALTQRQLAAAAGCSLTWLANIEAGCIPRQSEVLEHIEAALNAAEHERTTEPTNDSAPAGDRGAVKGRAGDRDAGYSTV